MKIEPSELNFTFERIEQHGLWWFFKVFWQGFQIGYANCFEENGRLCLDDIVTQNGTQYPQTLSHHFKKLFDQKRWNYRSCGVGKLLLQNVIKEARDGGIREIWGSVPRHLVEATPYLLKFYKSCGFRILDPDEECLVHNTVNKISLRLGNESAGIQV